MLPQIGRISFLNNPQIWWYLTRASAIIAWTLLVISVIWGILLSTRLFQPKDNPAWLMDLHKYLSGLSMIFVLTHMATLYFDSYAHFTIPQLLIPFESEYVKTGLEKLNNLPTALGVIAFWAMLSVLATSWIMKILPRKFWKGLHYTSYLAVIIVSFHAGWVGTDVRSWGYRILAIFLIFLTTTATIIRIFIPKTSNQLAVKIEGREPEIEPTRKVRISGIKKITPEILEIRFLSQREFPVWYPGAHINLYLPNGMQRQYSLCSDPADRFELTIAVLKSPKSRGGSEYIHEHLYENQSLEISNPRNNFELIPSSNYTFIAGGIGITAIKAMVESLPDSRNWKLIYLGRSRKSMAFVKEIERNFKDKVYIHADDEVGKPADLKKLLKNDAGDVYVCGPEPLLKAVQEIVPERKIHFERFSKVESKKKNNTNEGVRIIAKKTKIEFDVLPDQSLLEVMESEGLRVFASCREGLCGTCETKVLSGTPDHRDSLGTDEQKNKNQVFYPCVSRSKTKTLTLDL